MIHKTNKDVPSLTMVNNKFCLFNKVFITKHHLTCDTCHWVSSINKRVKVLTWSIPCESKMKPCICGDISRWDVPKFSNRIPNHM